MKTNLPVTDVERLLGEGTLIVSKTDPKGVIIYANAEFIEISGFTEPELLGQSHNIVRHPDMPSAVFRELWDALKAGKAWVGLLKNRCKNGDFYWVRANITPLWERSELVGYLSVRTRPERAEVEAATERYRRMNAGETLEPPLIQRLNPLPRLSMHALGWIAGISLLAGAVIPAGLLWAGDAAGPGLRGLGAGSALALALSGGALLAYILTRITVAVRHVAESLMEIAQGNFTSKLEAEGDDECAMAINALRCTQTRLGFDVAELRRVADEASRIKTALDHASAGVMVADEEFRIIYMNRAVQAMFKRAESDLRKVLPGFDADQILGANIDAFHPHPEHQRRLLAGLRDIHRSEIGVAGRSFSFIANPVADGRGKRIGTVMEWDDRTDQVAVEEQVSTLLTAFRVGDLQHRIDVEGRTGFTRRMGEGLNLVAEDVELSLKDFGRVIRGMAEGDLTRSTGYDGYEGVYAEFRANLMQSQSKLSEVFGQIRQAADFIYNASQEIAAGNNNLSQRAEEQAASLEQTASSMEQLTSTVNQNAENAIAANQVSSVARDLAQKGGDVVERAVAAMRDINDSSAKIANIIGTIDEIAFQTNLLALNASVEAARAGEQGRGFAVVATEVRNLAQRSAKAAKESRELIQNSLDKVGTGSALVTQSGGMLNDIVGSVQKTGDLVSEIAAASREQAQGIQQINGAVAQMDEITQQNAALAEQASAASVSMCEQAKNMVQLVGFFKTEDTAQAKRPAKATTASLDFSMARSKHLAWKVRIRDFLAGRESLTMAQAVSHRECDLGKWLYSTGLKQYGHLHEMRELEAEHEKMHGLVRTIIDKQQRGDALAAEADFRELQGLSDGIVALLTVVEKRGSLGRPPQSPNAKPRAYSPPPAPTPKTAVVGGTGDEWEEF
ncbi:methyl-accepting chemotaxis sensory transducer with Pas/Pac sensor [Methylomagnum ishizawai]|uniref:Methyl-accepting chemotaxis sensory transducer with Pas/Pac sensor n=1 Tax=Methylomagnum ishizawai TaxID=1760988 RepID=A0A1Y6D135_9GAMM|nr:methyl-accepting chemotaxis protein [Methylomagnum ishizawai]SMF94114.1 methyl-accepting chemotaxis sensory transducer with Pas/Pac sensor [Methylomagnum ishizawai]